SAAYELVRLTTSTAAAFNRRLFAGGVPRLLALETQEIDEIPDFSTTKSDATTIRVNPERFLAVKLPLSGTLDFDSANSIYYWEIFFHAPLLIAGALKTAQHFDAARTWYEHIFDPTAAGGTWKFLPFLSVDVE